VGVEEVMEGYNNGLLILVETVEGQSSSSYSTTLPAKGICIPSLQKILLNFHLQRVCSKLDYPCKSSGPEIWLSFKNILNIFLFKRNQASYTT
jgi:hypothetical protein